MEEGLSLQVIFDVGLARRLVYCGRQIDEGAQRDIAFHWHRKRVRVTPQKLFFKIHVYPRLKNELSFKKALPYFKICK
jgi:hypothetical protein